MTMENSQNKDTFTYTYSAKEQAEVQSIRKKYLPQEESKMERLRRLDRSANKKAQAVSLTVGILGTLVLGLGMSFAMSSLSEVLGAWRDSAMLIGILTGLAGLLLVAAAYPAYNRVLKKERERIAPEILRLSEDLINGEN